MSFGRPVLVYLREPCCRCTWHRYYRRHLHHGERTPLRAPRSYRTAAPCNRGQGDHMANASSSLIEDVDRRQFARLQKLVNPRPGYSKEPCGKGHGNPNKAISLWRRASLPDQCDPFSDLHGPCHRLPHRSPGDTRTHIYASRVNTALCFHSCE